MRISTDPVEEEILRRIPLEVILTAAAFGLLAALLFNPLTGLFFFAGGGLAALGFVWLKLSLARILLKERTRALRSGLFLYIARFMLILAVFFFIIFVYPRRLLAFAAGFSTVIPVFLVEAALALSRMRQWKD